MCLKLYVCIGYYSDIGLKYQFMGLHKLLPIEQFMSASIKGGTEISKAKLI